jgi:hypothetical protein
VVGADLNGLDAEGAEEEREISGPLLVLGAQPGGLRPGEVDGNDAAGLRVGVWNRDRADVRERSLPDGVLDDDGDELPAMLERLLPGRRLRRRQEVGDDEDERLGRQVALVLVEIDEALAELARGNAALNANVSASSVTVTEHGTIAPKERRVTKIVTNHS